MKPKFIFASALIALLSLGVMPETKSDYDRSYDFSKLRTWDFKVLNRMPTDPVGTNSLWNQRVRDGVKQHLAGIGFERINDGNPDFILGYFMGIKEKYDIRYIDYGFPGRWGSGAAGADGMAGDQATARLILENPLQRINISHRCYRPKFQSTGLARIRYTNN